MEENHITGITCSVPGGDGIPERKFCRSLSRIWFSAAGADGADVLDDVLLVPMQKMICMYTTSE